MSQSLHAVALVAALLGLLLWTRRRSGIDVAAVPAVVMCGLGLVVFTGGLLRVLQPATWAVLVAGVLALVHELVRHRRESLATLRHPVVLVLGAAAAGLVVYLHGLEFVHYDNFSHWALVVRVMLRENAFPTTADPVIAFTSYPLGSAGVAYAFSRLLGGEEWQAMLGQALLTVSTLLALAQFTRRHRWVGALAAVAAYPVVLSHTNQATTLLVDGLVATLAAAALLIAVRHRRRLRQALVPLAVVLAYLAVVKSSALFFVLVAQFLVVVLVVASGRHRRRPSGSPRPAVVPPVRLAAVVLAPWLAFGAWTLHVDRTFPHVAGSPHSLDSSRMEEVLAEKSPAVRRQISALVLDGLRTDTAAWLGLAVGLLVLLLLWRRRHVTGWVALATAVAGLVGTAAYAAGIVATYLSSMPTSEAMHLAGFRRYTGTGHLVLVLLAVAGLLTVLDAVHRLVGRIVATAAGAAVLVAVGGPLGSPETLPRSALFGDLRSAADRAVAGREVGPADRVCVVVSARDASYQRFLVRYLLLTPDVQEKVVTPETSQNLLEPCDAVVILEPNPRAVEMLAELGRPAPHDPPVMVGR